MTQSLDLLTIGQPQRDLRPQESVSKADEAAWNEEARAAGLDDVTEEGTVDEPKGESNEAEAQATTREDADEPKLEVIEDQDPLGAEVAAVATGLPTNSTLSELLMGVTSEPSAAAAETPSPTLASPDLAATPASPELAPELAKLLTGEVTPQELLEQEQTDATQVDSDIEFEALDQEAEQGQIDVEVQAAETEPDFFDLLPSEIVLEKPTETSASESDSRAGRTPSTQTSARVDPVSAIVQTINNTTSTPGPQAIRAPESTQAALAALEARASAILNSPEAVRITGSELGGAIDVRIRSGKGGWEVVLEPHKTSQAEKLAGSITAIESLLRSRGLNARRVSLSREKARAEEDDNQRRDHATLSSNFDQKLASYGEGDRA